jgi:hypothetical protein
MGAAGSGQHKLRSTFQDVRDVLGQRVPLGGRIRSRGRIRRSRLRLLLDAREFLPIKRIAGKLVSQTGEQRPGLAGVVVAKRGNGQ